MFAPTVVVSSGDYAAFGRKLSAALTEKTRNAPKAAGLARKLAPETMRIDERINAIRTWVARHIRPAGPALNELPWSAFTPADVTLQSGYGDSADRAILLGAMLKAAGVDYRFVAATELGLRGWRRPARSCVRRRTSSPRCWSICRVSTAI